MGFESPGYYDDKLSAKRLKCCYDIAPPRIQQYLQAEIDFVLSRISPNDTVLELGCGYGRVLKCLCGKAQAAIGIDTSLPSLLMAKEHLVTLQNFELIRTNAVQPALGSRKFNLVCCIQNGLSALKVDNNQLLEESIRITKPGGSILFSSYLKRFWKYRLEWFEIQAQEGLLGEIDYEKTGDGEIYCKDGFKATTIEPSEFRTLISQVGFPYQLYEIDNSSIFCEIYVGN